MQIMEYLQQQTAAIAVPRRVGKDRHKEVRTHIADEMKRLGLEPFYGGDFIIEQQAEYAQHDGGSETLYNIAGISRGNTQEAAPVLVGAHYDSIIAGECADDNATSVAAMLYMAGEFSRLEHERSIIFAAFDAEEPPYFGSPAMGSEQFMRQFFNEQGPSLSIIMDLLAHKSSIMADKIACSGAENSPELLGMLRSASREDLAIVPVTEPCVQELSDHRNILSRNYDYLFFSSGHWPGYHNEEDTIDNVDFDKLVRFNHILKDIITMSASHRGAYETGNCRDAIQQDCWQIIGRAIGCAENDSIEDMALKIIQIKYRE